MERIFASLKVYDFDVVTALLAGKKKPKNLGGFIRFLEKRLPSALSAAAIEEICRLYALYECEMGRSYSYEPDEFAPNYFNELQAE